MWLLDPTDLTVTSDVSDFNVTSPPEITPVTSPAAVSNTTIQNALNLNTNVILNTIGSPNSGAETGAITVNAPVAWTTATTLTLNAAGNIQINSPITGSDPGSVLALNAAGTVSQSNAGTIAVGTLTGTSTGGTTLTAANSIDTLGSFINSGDGSFWFSNTKSLTVTGPITGGSGVSGTGGLETSVLIETTGPASTLAVAGVITGSNAVGVGTPYAVELFATGAITETSAGSINAGSLLARTQNDAGAPIVLDSAGNKVDLVNLSSLNSSLTGLAPGAITFSNSTGVAIAGVGGPIPTGLELGVVTAATATLEVGGALTQTAAGRVTASGTTLSATSINLPNANDFDAAGGALTATATSGPIAVTDAGALMLANVTTPGTLSITASGALTQTATGKVMASGTTLLATSINLPNANDFDATGGGIGGKRSKRANNGH